MERQKEQAAQESIEEINNLSGDNTLDYTAYQVNNVKEVWKQSSKADIVKGILFLLFFLGCCAGFVVCMCLEYIVWGFVCFGLGVGEILIALICVKALERRSLKLKKGHTYTKATATVLGCTMSSQSSGGSRRHTQIYNTTYKVFLNNKKVAFSKEYYDVGDKVDINIDTKNPKHIVIIGKHKDIFDLEENEF